MDRDWSASRSGRPLPALTEVQRALVDRLRWAGSAVPADRLVAEVDVRTPHARWLGLAGLVAAGFVVKDGASRVSLA